MADILEEGVKMSALSVSCKNIHTLSGLDREDLNLLMSGLHRIKGNLEQPDIDKVNDLLEVMK